MNRFAFLSLACFTTTLACGETRDAPLLTVAGSARIQNEAAPAPLVPALAFWNRDTDEYEIVDAEVTGEFPENFVFDVFEAPPESTFVGGKDAALEGEPRLTVGYITAVTPDHPPSVSVEKGEYVAGVSRNYAVLYLAEPAAPSSFVAYSYGGRQRMDAGYHVLKFERMPEEARENAEACREEAEAVALQGYNEAHGTSYEQSETPDTVEFMREVARRYFDEVLEQTCPLDDYVITEVNTGVADPIEVEIALGGGTGLYF